MDYKMTDIMTKDYSPLQAAKAQHKVEKETTRLDEIMRELSWISSTASTLVSSKASHIERLIGTVPPAYGSVSDEPANSDSLSVIERMITSIKDSLNTLNEFDRHLEKNL